LTSLGKKMARAKVSFTPILPKGDFDIKFYKEAWERTLRSQVKPDLINLFKRTTSGWDNKPVFRGTINKSTEFLRLLVKATGENANIYAMIDITGAKRHPITARQGRLLKYRPGYSPATSPGRIQSRRKRRSGPIVTARSIDHPGFKAREFSATIAKRYQPTYVKHMNEATHRATKDMGRNL
jgi:hypothetical protein